VRVPHGFTCSKAADRHTVFDYVRDHVNLRIALDERTAGLLDWRLIQFAKAPAEANQILVGEVLLSEQEHLMIEPCTVNQLKAIGRKFAEIYTSNLCAKRLVAGNNVHCAKFYQNWRIRLATDYPDFTDFKSA